MKEMTLEEKMRKFWDFLNEAETIDSTCFNVICWKKSAELKLGSHYVDPLISAWACTLETTFPEYLLKLYKVI